MAPPLDLETAQARLLAMATPLPVERVAPEHALGRFLAEPLVALRDQPAADLSAMDGYAVSANDMAGPWSVIGESAAGHPFSGPVSEGQAVRIATGAVVPDGAGAVILQEDVTRESDRVALAGTAPHPPDKHIRRRGLDFIRAEEIMPPGIRLTPARIALALSAGHRHLPVRRAPRIAVMDTGDELASGPEHPEAHRIPASNGAMLAAMLAPLSSDVVRAGPVADSMDALAAALKAASEADIIVTSGGASVGDRDFIRPALEAWGATLEFWRVAIKPGKPLLIARRERANRPQIIVGLPGNPVSSFVTAHLFLLPFVRAMMGDRAPLPFTFRVRTAEALVANPGRRQFQRGFWDGQGIRLQTVQDSGAVAALSASNVLIDRPADAPAVAKGEEVTAYLLENGGIA